MTLKTVSLAYFIPGLLMLIFFSCGHREETISETHENKTDLSLENIKDSVSPENKKKTDDRSNTALYFESLGLIDIQQIDTSIRVNLRYSDTSNFLGMDLYGDLKKAYLPPDVARKLEQASEILQSNHPDLRLMVWDAVRPLSVQQTMWDSCSVPVNRRFWYVTPPETRSLHNFGAAVDVTLVTVNGEYCDMGTGFDHFGEKAYTTNENLLVQQGKISSEARDNRVLLRNVMSQAGFFPIDYEWWHFNSCSRNVAKSKYPLIFGLSKNN